VIPSKLSIDSDSTISKITLEPIFTLGAFEGCRMLFEALKYPKWRD
jgi:hypothetical protein